MTTAKNGRRLRVCFRITSQPLSGTDFPHQWRRLDVPDGLQRAGDRRCAYRALHVGAQGLFPEVKIATKRRALRRKADGTAIPLPIFVAIDIADVRLS
jgi:hypothetical protein